MCCSLPSLRTLQRYMERLSPAYGFQEYTFTMMKEQAAHMDEAKRHGKWLLNLAKGLSRARFLLN